MRIGQVRKNEHGVRVMAFRLQVDSDYSESEKQFDDAAEGPVAGAAPIRLPGQGHRVT